VYDASGAKMRKITIDNSTATPVTVTTEYINGVEYRNNVTQRIANAEGQITRTATATFQKEYDLRDHLGNTRVTFSDLNNDGLVNDAEILQSNNYYPFGLNMEMNTNGAQGNNKYQYNGKEWNDDFGLGLNDYGARMYDPAIGRWNSVDPLAEKMRRYSPYNYGFDNPIKTIDPDGMMGMNFDAGGGSEGHTGEAQTGYQESGGFSHDNDNAQINPDVANIGGKSDFKSGEEHSGGGAPINNQGSKNDNNSQLFNDPEGKKSNFQVDKRADGMVLAGKAGQMKGGGDPDKKSVDPPKNPSFLKKILNSLFAVSRTPDFYSFNVGVGVIVGWSGEYIIDRYGNHYKSVAGIGIGKTPWLVSGSISANWLEQSRTPSSEELVNFLSGHGFNIGGGFIIGGSLSISPSPYPSERNNSPRAWGVGLYSPQVGVSYNYVFENGVILNK